MRRLALRSASGNSIAHALGVLCVSFLAACGAPGAVDIPITVSLYDTLPPARVAQFEEARALSIQGDVHAARAAFERLFESMPDCVIAGIWLQECELAALVADTHDENRSRASLATRFEGAALESPTAANFVLAARVATSPGAAQVALDRAEELDPRCAWVHYGRAFLAAQESDWPAARAHIKRAKEADRGHLWTHWLEAWILTRTSSLDDAVSALQGFVERATDDPRIEPRLLDEARLDLALVWTLRDEPRKARALVALVERGHVDAARKLTALASIEQALGRLGPALSAAEAAEQAAPGDILPVVQQALLFDEWLGDDARAEASWRRVLDMARKSPQLTSVLERTRAGVRLERFAASRAARSRP